jgi:hypothetical protein
MIIIFLGDNVISHDGWEFTSVVRSDGKLSSSEFPGIHVPAFPEYVHRTVPHPSGCNE